MIEQDFIELMLSHGFQPGQIIADGTYHRFPVRKSDKDGYYNLDANGFGVFGNWKTGDQYKFRSGKTEQLTEQERAESHAKYKAENRRRAAEKENAEARAANEAKRIWEAAQSTGADHWYIVKKKIRTTGTRLDASGTLIYPIYENGKIVNLQRIIPDGKRFLPDARKRGCYGIVDGLRDVIFIAEGFATASSVNEATGRCCVVALDAGNLMPVAKAMRGKFGVAQKIVIAADNDQFTEVKGKPFNIGLVEAEKAAAEIYAEVKYPHFPSDGERLTDWNDWACKFGIGAVKDELIVSGDAGSHELECFDEYSPVSDNTQELQFSLDDKGRPQGTIENLLVVAQKRRIILRYNVIKKQEEILIPNETYSLDNQLNASFARLLSFCKEEDMPTAQMGDFLTYICDKNQYNPVTTWVTSAPWDGVSRLQEFYDTISSSDKIVKELILKRWMVSAIATAFAPDGLATRGVLVFQGEQYLGKTSWFKKLAPRELDVMKDGYILRLDDKDNIFQCLSHWLIELGELEATFKKSDIAQLKAFIPMDKDILRRPYARKDSQYGRRTVFFASVNIKEFLFDETGNTRFWSIPVTGIRYDHTIDMQQLWAEFYQMFLAGEPYIMSAEEMKLINTNNDEFMGADYHEELAARRFDWGNLEWGYGMWKTSTEVCHQVGIINPKQIDLNRMSRAIRKYNGNKSKKSNGVRLLLVPIENQQQQYG